jgi:hypothetical protein
LDHSEGTSEQSATATETRMTLHAVPEGPPVENDGTRERIQLEHRLAQIAERLRVLQETRAQAIRAEREDWPRRERRWHERRRT